MVGASFSTLSPNRGMENSTGTSNLSLSFFFCFSLRSQSFSSDNFRTPIYKQICPPRWIIIFIEFFGFVSSSARRRCSRVHGRRRSDRRRTNRRKRRAAPRRRRRRRRRRLRVRAARRGYADHLGTDALHHNAHITYVTVSALESY